MKTHISVIIPAHNEEKYIKRCMDSIKAADSVFPGNTEIIVVCNRCTDRTESIAAENGAVTIINEDRCIAKVRNAGIEVAKGKIIVTIDADNRMTKNTLREIYSLLRSGKYIGGGVPIRFERYSFPLWCNDILCRVSFKLTGLYSGIFWAEKKTFDAIGGFADLKAMEDVATAKLLKKYGKTQGKKYTTLRRNYLINSTRKYDDLGDWLYFRLMIENAGTLIKAGFGDKSGMEKLLDDMFYDYNDRQKKSEKKALLVIDMQNDYLWDKRKAMFTYDTRELTGNVNKAIHKYKEKGYDIIYIKHILPKIMWGVGFSIRGTKGAELYSDLDLVSDHIFEKNRSDTYTAKAFREFMKAQDYSEVVLCGVDECGCVGATAKGAVKTGAKVRMIEDCIGRRFPDKKVQKMREKLKASGVKYI